MTPFLLDKLKRVVNPSQAKRPLIKPSRTSGKESSSQDKQLILGRPRPPFRLNPAALLVPAIPTIIGELNVFIRFRKSNLFFLYPLEPFPYIDNI